jgi:hypothetical protein
VLAFAAEHRLVLAAQIQLLLGVSAPAAYKRVHALRRAGCLRFARRLAGPGFYQIDRSGLAAIDSPLSRPRDIELASYQHDLGLGWLWLAAQLGAFGRVDEIISERRTRAHDGRLPGGFEPLGTRLPGVGPRGGEGRHYPDLVLRCSTGHRVAVELELTTKARVRREQILGAYALDPRIDRVLYLVCDPAIGIAIERSAAAMGVSSLIRVQRVSLQPAGCGAGGTEREAARPPTGRPRVSEGRERATAGSGLAR